MKLSEIKLFKQKTNRLDFYVASVFGLLTTNNKAFLSQLFRGLNQDFASTTHCIDFTKGILPDLSYDLDTGSSLIKKRTARHSFVRKTPIDSGAHGKIYLNSDGDKIYKKIYLEGTSQKDVEEKTRAIFVEALIQTIISNDENYGKYVCKILGLYKSMEVSVSSATTRQQSPVRTLTLYLVMRPLYKNFWEALAYRRTVLTKMKKNEFIPILFKIAEILDYFKKTYNFHHRDLHAGNIMFPSKNGDEIDWASPTIIDFGLSCLTYKYNKTPTVYSFVPDNVIPVEESLPKLYPRIIESPCESYDLLILITSLLQYSSKHLDDDCIEFLKKATEGNNGRNLYEDLPSLKETYDAASLFHMVYPDVILNEDGPLYDAVLPYMPFKHIEPSQFIQYAITESDKTQAAILKRRRTMYQKKSRPTGGRRVTRRNKKV